MATIVHITDLHLYADPLQQLKGMATLESFAAVLAAAQRDFPHPDAVILGGDLAQDESSVAYIRLAEMLADWPVPYMVTPGNHASLHGLRSLLLPALAESSQCAEELNIGCWQVLALNTHAPAEVGGRLDADALQALDHSLSRSTAAHALIALHHPPVAVGSRWMDEIGLLNADDFWSVVDRYAHVRVTLNGHIHQAFDADHGRVRVLGSPSTCIQFRPHCATFALDARSPAYRWLELGDDGSIRTGIHRIEGFVPEDINDNTFY